METTTHALASVCADIAALMGFSRPAGQCFAAIWRSARAPCADDLTAELGLSRSNVSTALKELRQAGLVSVARAPGVRKEYFIAPSDPWNVLRLLLAARRGRDIAPLLDRVLSAEAAVPDARFAALHETLSSIDKWMAALARPDSPALRSAFTLPTTDDRNAPKKKKKKKKAG
jgi:DNA-binding transcriptional regulator GbsR (MarR family)